ncbi:MAG: BON domain-containing protein, partial [Gemmobacter sp.]|nr:BON domain-containing protein [Gemmobacter sp.]
MRKPHPLLNARWLAGGAFLAAAVLAIVTSVFAAGAIESRGERMVERLLIPAGMDWVNVSADGLIVTLSGTAPTEAKRFRAVSIAGTVIDSSRVIDAMSVTPASALTAPRFSLELLRNDDGISMIGLVPQGWDAAAQVELVNTLVTDGDVTNMLETAD